MDTRDVTFHEEKEEEYIDMELYSSPESREFEFQMSISFHDTHPADDLFFNGKLLPLHHLPTTTAAAAAATQEPHLSPDDQFIEWSNELNSFIINKTTSTWINKMKNSTLGMKLRGYLKSMFNNSSRNFRTPDKINVMKRIEEAAQARRRSFSGGSSSSSSSSSSSNASSFSNGDRRSSCAAEVEGFIEAAIAHCKKSHHI